MSELSLQSKVMIFVCLDDIALELHLKNNSGAYFVFPICEDMRVGMRMDNKIPFRLSRYFILIVESYRHYVRKQLEGTGLGLSEYPILQVLFNCRENGDEGLSQAFIADAMERDPALITRGVKKLVEKGFVEVHQDENNASRHVVCLTAAGLDAARNVNDVIAAWENAAWKCLNGQNLQNFEDALKRIKNLDVENI